MVTLNDKKTTTSREIKDALSSNLNIVADDSRLKTIVNKIADSRYAFKLLGETGTLPIAYERPSLLYKNWLYVVGAHVTGCGLIIIDTNTMKIVKQVSGLIEDPQIPTAMVKDDKYYYIGFSSGGLLVKGLLETGEVVTIITQVISATRAMCIDDDYLYIAPSIGRLQKINKTTLTIVQTGNVIYYSPQDLKCVGDYIYVTGVGTSPNTGVVAKIAKSDINTIVSMTSNVYNSVTTSRMLIDEEYLYTASVTGVIKKWLLSDLSYIGDFYSNGANIYTIKKLLNNIWIGDINGKTSRLDSDGNLLSILTTSQSPNYVLEIDESNQILYRKASNDITVAKYQIIDNLQNNTSTTAIKTIDLVTLNTPGTWVDTVYTLNGMAMTCNTLTNGYLRQLSFTGTTIVDSEFVIHNFNANKKLTAATNYILNGVKSTDSLSTVFIRLILAENADGSGATQVIEKVAGDFTVTTTTHLYYKISIIIKSGVTLSSSLYSNIPTLYPK